MPMTEKGPLRFCPNTGMNVARMWRAQTVFIEPQKFGEKTGGPTIEEERREPRPPEMSSRQTARGGHRKGGEALPDQSDKISLPRRGIAANGRRGNCWSDSTDDCFLSAERAGAAPFLSALRPRFGSWSPKIGFAARRGAVMRERDEDEARVAA